MIVVCGRQAGGRTGSQNGFKYITYHKMTWRLVEPNQVSTYSSLQSHVGGNEEDFLEGADDEMLAC